MNTEHRVTSFNIRGLKGKTEAIKQLQNGTIIIAVQETWMRKRDRQWRKSLTAEKGPEPEQNACRGYGGFGFLIQEPLRYKKIQKLSTPTYQLIKIKMTEVYITKIYIYPRANGKEEDEIPENLKKKSRGKYIEMGDVNAIHNEWDNKTKPRGKKLKRLAHNNGWTIKATKAHTCHTSFRNSTPDLFLIKGVRTTIPTIVKGDWSTYSDH